MNIANNHQAYADFDESTTPEHMISLREAQTLDGLFRARVKRSPNAEAYRFFSKRTEAWQSMTWHEVAVQVSRWQEALNNEHYAKGDRVAVMMDNCVYWPILDQAVLGLGLVLVPLYANDRADNMAYVLKDSGAKFLLIKEQAQLDLLEQVADQLDGILIKSVLSLGSDVLNVQCIDDWLPETGHEVVIEHSPNALASIVYTSGTTGNPKGVMLSHKNMLWNAWAGLQSMMLYPEDQHLSFLPLSHTLERTVGYYLMMMAGAKVAYNRSIPELAEDLQIIKPTIMITVPRIFERVHGKIISKLEEGSAIKRGLFHKAVNLGWQRFEIDQGRAKWRASQLIQPLLDKLVGSKIRERLGGRVRIAIIGGAAMPEPIARVFLALGIPILQGYGLTETSPVISVNSFQHNDPASVGKVFDDIEIKHDANTQELSVRGPGVMQGYWHNESATAEVLDDDGWLKTGDITRLENDYLYITGRVKDIIVLANGEKIPPTDVEAAISADILLEQVMVIGEGRPYLSALIVLNPEEETRIKKRLSVTSTEALKEEIQLRIRSSLHDFPGYARIRQFEIIEDEFTIENGLITPTLKIKRNKIAAQYADAIESLYQGHI
ncbi:MAG: long-chain fatty acid--CoA ligase [Arenicellales bacterium]